MNKKILIGSIIAVAILVGVSLTSVVGYQSVESNNITSSPLFNVRSGRATEKDSSYVTCNYLGKGEDAVISIPNRNEKIESLILQLKNKLRIEEELNGFLPNNIPELFNQLEINEDLKDKIDDIEIDLFTVNDACPITTDPIPLICNIYGVLFLIGVIIIQILYLPIAIVDFAIRLVKGIKLIAEVGLEILIEYITLISEALKDFFQNQWSPGILIYVTIIWLLSYLV